ncbi:MAG: glycosyltransferase [Burkholderiaceae bacterium]|nr:glycosyltransferase [Burkholderiaceae bacterium]
MASGPRRRLAHVVNTLNPGGTERLVVDMATSLVAEFDIMVLCLDETGAWAQTLRDLGIAVYGLRRQPGIDLSVAWRLAQRLREFRADIVHAHQSSAWFYSALARLLYRPPRLLFEEHGRFFPEADRPLKRFVNRVLIRRLTHRCVAVSRDVRCRLVRYEGLKPADIEVVYNGTVPVQPLDAAARQRLRAGLGFARDHFVIGTIGRFDPVKNLPMLVSAVADVATESERVRAVMVGDGPESPAIRRRIEASGLTDRIVLTGHRDDARQLVQGLDLFVLTSLSEGTSMALLEAVAAGVPVAVTGVGGNGEIVDADRTGWVVPSGDVQALSAVFREALARPDLARRMADAGRRRFEERFTFRHMLDAYRALYEELSGHERLGAGHARA